MFEYYSQTYFRQTGPHRCLFKNDSTSSESNPSNTTTQTDARIAGTDDSVIATNGAQVDRSVNINSESLDAEFAALAFSTIDEANRQAGSSVRDAVDANQRTVEQALITNLNATREVLESNNQVATAALEQNNVAQQFAYDFAKSTNTGAAALTSDIVERVLQLADQTGAESRDFVRNVANDLYTANQSQDATVSREIIKYGAITAAIIAAIWAFKK